MTTKIRYINASIRTPNGSAPYKSLNFAAVGPDGKDLKDAQGNVIRVTRGAPVPGGADLHTLATTMRGVKVEDGTSEKTSGVFCLDLQPVQIRKSRFETGDMTYVRNPELGQVTLDAEIEPIVDKAGKAMVSEKRDGVAYAYYRLVRPIGVAEFHVSMFGAISSELPAQAAAEVPEEAAA